MTSDDFDVRLRAIENELASLREWRNTVASFMQDSKDRNTRAPVLLFAAISMTSGVASVVVQLWLSGR